MTRCMCMMCMGACVCVRACVCVPMMRCARACARCVCVVVQLAKGKMSVEEQLGISEQRVEQAR